MDYRDEVREFLTSRRAKLTPEQAGLPAGSNRRVPGLRRAEVAVLANVSVEYYARLERGGLAGASDTVLDSLARALRLDEAERSYLFDLAKAAGRAPQARPRRRATKNWTPRQSLVQLLDSIGSPAIVRNGRLDIVAANRLGRAFYDDIFASAEHPPNFARFCYLDTERSQRFYPDWTTAADINVAMLRTEAGRDPHDKGLQDLIGELSTRSEEFRTRWAARNVRIHGSGRKRVHHTVAGDLDMTYEELELIAEPGLVLLVYTAEPASPSYERLQLLASWTGTEAQPRVEEQASLADQSGEELGERRGPPLLGGPGGLGQVAQQLGDPRALP
ncbi:helix-turn-helix transcriptional regulator [Glycomyces artemisiae]|uniref:Helix-turn-helix protein n=2 Tax=Glycomyces artemisiae TaxID=1076443 RepID=A0A2T0UFK7_9ACTN|nr:helix-turn-helix transcriptional regulator [Glycomyces artemisiae]PRY56730.1 helix-turn-helix protein [Glycomyces artemisiae]